MVKNPILIIGIFLASAFWFLIFAEFFDIGYTIHNNYFWIAMTLAASFLAMYSILTQKSEFEKLLVFKRKYIIIGVLHAIVLYGFTRFGVYIAQNLFDFVVPQIEAIYSTKSQMNDLYIGSLLVFLIGPSEEIFWRGFVQNKLDKITTPTKAFLIATFIYALVHIWALNPMLMLAALILGGHWGLMFKKYKSIVPGLISHALWDLMIFVAFPINI